MITSLKSFALAGFVFVFVHCANAATLVEFDTPYIFAEVVQGKINGYYGSSLPEIDGRPSASCEFFFTSDLIDPAKHGHLLITTYYTDGDFEKRSRDDVLHGELVIEKERWTLQMDQVPFGCLSAAGGGFLKGAAIPNDVTARTEFIGIFVVRKKTHFFERRGNSFFGKKGFLVPGDVVIAYQKNSGFYSVKYLNITTSVVTQGWVPANNVSDPFPNNL